MAEENEQEQEIATPEQEARVSAAHVCAFCPGTEPVQPTMFASGGGLHWWRCPDCGSLNSYALPQPLEASTAAGPVAPEAPEGEAESNG